MASPNSSHCTATVIATHVRSKDSSILVEAGGIVPTQWFLERDANVEQPEPPEPPAKRLKSEGYQRGRTTLPRFRGPTTPTISKAVSAKFSKPDPATWIPVVRVSVDLHFPETALTKDASPEAIRRDVDFDGAESVSVKMSLQESSEDTMRLELELFGESDECLIVDSTAVHDNVFENVIESMNSRVWGHDHYVKLMSTLTRSRGELYTVVRLSTTLYHASNVPKNWSVIDRLYPGLSRGDKGQRGSVSGEFPDNDDGAYAGDDLSNQYVSERKRFIQNANRIWSSQDFYDNAHVTQKDVDTSEDFKGLLETELYPFQKRAVHWMLRRELVDSDDSGRAQEIPNEEKDIDDIDEWQEDVDVDGNSFYINPLRGVMCRDRDGCEGDIRNKGILAEEMGLGKTLEVTALALLHRRPTADLAATVFDQESQIQLRTSKATLIITPPSILGQWKAELARHAPALKVMHYERVSTKKTQKPEQQMLADLCDHYDVVLTTYQVLQKEIHFAVEPPARNMRQARKYERPRSPLVRVHWWRICLDEAQMLESGVSAAARVACRLQRVNSWAVSGTPIRKNVQDLEALLMFLQYQPYRPMLTPWNEPHSRPFQWNFLQRVFRTLALRHTKANIQEDLHLPPQKRVVITVPFSAVEQQHYTTMFSQMAEEVGLNIDGSPLDEHFDLEDTETIAKMRSWLVRLRQTCLHPEVGGKNRRALGKGQMALRTVEEVLGVMIDQNETAIRTEEKAWLASMLLRAHIYGNAADDEHRSEKALEVYLEAKAHSERMVGEARALLQTARDNQEKHGEVKVESEEEDDEDSSSEATPLLGRLRNNLRLALQLHHACTFFVATAYHQIKSNESLTVPESDKWLELESYETALYEKAKFLRREILRDTSRKAEVYMMRIKELASSNLLTKMPEIADLEAMGGIESRRLVDKSDELFDVIRDQNKAIVKWRSKMADYLVKPLVDDDDSNETTGEEYEDSTKLQDELYAYFDAFKAILADLNTFLTGEKAPLIDHEVKDTIKRCRAYLDHKTLEEHKGFVHAPQLTLELLGIRNSFVRRNKGDSVRGVIQEARAMEGSIQSSHANLRAAEHAIVVQHMHSVQGVFNAYTKAIAGLEKELQLFRSTQNLRIDFYKRLQEVSDDVSPYKDSETDATLDLTALQTTVHTEEQQEKSLAKLKTKNRFLLHLRDENGSQTEAKICVICQSAFELGVLTVCGHQFCKECINLWWNAHHNCPVCKQRLKLVDFHSITYRPQELKAQEEANNNSSTSKANAAPPPTSIYTDVDPVLLRQIQSIDLPKSYGTKIDTLGRHLHHLRATDPGAKSVIFSQFREFLDVLSNALTTFKIPHARLGARRDAAELFKRDPAVDCLLMDAKGGAEGLTLTVATHVFICEPLVNGAIEVQAVARVHRIGQTRPTTVWMYLVDDTVEQAVYDISVRKRRAHVRERMLMQQGAGGRETDADARAGADAGLDGDAAATASDAVKEDAIEAADVEQMQSQPLSKLLAGGKGGGEHVGKDELWQCLFGQPMVGGGRGPGRYEGEGEGEGLFERALERSRRAGAAEARAGAGASR